jgi:hypothetical protein
LSNDLHFAILAPVPLEHLQTGLDVCAKKGSVAFGTRKWELFRSLDQKRDGQPVAALIYPSHDEDLSAKDTFIVSWFGWYVRSIDSKGGAHPDGMKYRPPDDGRLPGGQQRTLGCLLARRRPSRAAEGKAATDQQNSGLQGRMAQECAAARA